MQNLIGVTIGNYQIVEQLGRGGMANVYKAYHPGLAVYRAVKVIRPDLSRTQSFQERFQREARAIAGLRHPNIVQVHDFGQHEDLFYMVMEYVEGEDLKARIQREGPIRPFAEAIRIAEQVASGLGYAHERGILHRDVKPDNVLLAKDGTAILADFGIAKIVGSEDPQLTATGVGIGTPNYMAPELAKGAKEASPAADLYALGVVLYEMLTARAPFTADTPLAVLHRVLHDPVPAPRQFAADIPDALQGMVLKAMAFEVRDRYPNAAALIEAGRQSLLGAGPDRAPEGGVQPSRDTPRKTPAPAEEAQAAAGTGSRNTLIAVGVAGLLLLAFLGLAAVWGWRWYKSLDLEAAAESLLAGSAESPAPIAEPAPGDDGEPPADGAGDSGTSEPTAAGDEPQGREERTVEPRATAASQPASPSISTPRSSASDGPATGPSAPSAAVPAPMGSDAVTGSGTADPRPAAPAYQAVAGGPRHGGTLRFGRPISGEIEPEETVEYDLEVRRPTYIYFDVVFANRPATYTLYDADGVEVFRQHGNDLGPLRLERAGWYRLSVETDAEIPVRYEIEFRQVGG